MHIHHVPKPRRVIGFVGLVAAALSIATLLSSSAAAPAPTYTVVRACPRGAPVLSLDNPAPGDVLPTGDIVFSGVALDPAATGSAGITRVDLFLGDRDAGGVFLGSAIPGYGTGATALWQT